MVGFRGQKLEWARRRRPRKGEQLIKTGNCRVESTRSRGRMAVPEKEALRQWLVSHHGMNTTKAWGRCLVSNENVRLNGIEVGLA